MNFYSNKTERKECYEKEDNFNLYDNADVCMFVRRYAAGSVGGDK